MRKIKKKHKKEMIKLCTKTSRRSAKSWGQNSNKKRVEKIGKGSKPERKPEGKETQHI
jgi:hypothetical protein